eukprot:TRINITY_DN4458_c0_g1_i1.p1 TRINITY_DN4458_c0_g1~~TRINITY_DN4458_c0_g1_i1.p1  ORF type:complete len:711 (+),score=216.58 TRINITY_DN4458_c0_g1_i1:32-2134(+)
MTSVVKHSSASLLSLRSRGRSFRPVVPLSSLASASSTPAGVAAASAIAAIVSPDETLPAATIDGVNAAGVGGNPEDYEDLKSPEVVSPGGGGAEPSIAITRITVKDLMAVRAQFTSPPPDFPLDLPCLAADSAAESKSSSFRGRAKNAHASKPGKQPSASKQPSIGNAFSASNAAAALSHSDSAWKRKEASGVEKLLRTLTGLLNRLTVDSFDSLCMKFVNAVKIECKSFDVLKQIVHLVHDKALAEMNFGDLYPRLCEVLSSELPSFERSVPNAGVGAVEKVSFKRVMLEQCQAEFEKQISLARELDEALADAENAADEDPDTLEHRQKQKDRMLGSMKFLGELYVRGMMPAKVITFCILQFLRDLDSPSVTNMESLCTLLTTCGKKLEVDSELKFTIKSKANPMKVWFSQLQTIVNTADLPTRNRFQIIDLIDLRRNSWVPRRHVEKAQKIADIHDGTAEIRRLNASVSGAARFLVPQKDSRSKKVKAAEKPRKNGDRYANFRKVKRITSRQKFIPKPVSSLEEHYASGGERDEKELDSYEDYSAQNFEIHAEAETTIRGFIEEFMEVRDYGEAARCLAEVNVEPLVKNVNFVYQTLMIGAEEPDAKRRQALALLLSGFIKKGIVSSKQLSVGLSHLFDILADVAIDSPSAPKNLSEILKSIIAETGGKVDSSHVAEAREITQTGKSQEVDDVVDASK